MRGKVGVVTFHRSLNYGAILQAYGLVKTIEKLGFQCELIDYRNKLLENRDSIARFVKTKGLLRNLYNYFEFPYWSIRRQRFNNFLKLINVGNRKVDCINQEVEMNYYKIFVGSDQVWNYKVTGADKNYLLKELRDSTKKNSYAASFGLSNIPDDIYNYYTECLKDFHMISVREPQGVEIVKKLIGREAEIVLDPSLLLTGQDWKELFKKEDPIKGEYILIYQRAYSKTLLEFAKRLARITGCKLVTINGNPRQIVKAKYVLAAGPIEWLRLMYNAKYIVTNSFHGVAFSLNFNKQFFVELLDEKFGVNSRLENILEYFQLEDRKIDIKSDIGFTQIDYKSINMKLEQARKESLTFLENALEK